MKKQKLNRDLNRLKNFSQDHPWKINQLPSGIFAKYHYAMRAMGISDHNYYKHLRRYSNDTASVDKNVQVNHDKIPKGLYPISQGYGEDLSNRPKEDIITPKKLVNRINRFQKKLPKMSYDNLRTIISDKTADMLDVEAQPHNNLHHYKIDYKKTHHIPVSHISWNRIKRHNAFAQKWEKGGSSKLGLEPSEDKYENDMNKLEVASHKSRHLADNGMAEYNRANDLYRTDISPRFREYDIDKQSVRNMNHKIGMHKFQYSNSKRTQPKLNTIKNNFGYSENDMYNGIASQLQRAKHFYHKATKQINKQFIKPHYYDYLNYEITKTYHGKIANKLNQHPISAKSMNLYSGKQVKNFLKKDIDSLEKTSKGINQSNPTIIKNLQKVDMHKSTAKRTIKKALTKDKTKMHQIEPYQVYSGENLQAGKLTPISNKGIKQLVNSIKNSSRVQNVFNKKKVNNNYNINSKKSLPKYHKYPSFKPQSNGLDNHKKRFVGTDKMDKKVNKHVLNKKFVSIKNNHDRQ